MFLKEPLGAIMVDNGKLLAACVSVWQLQAVAKWQVLTLSDISTAILLTDLTCACN